MDEFRNHPQWFFGTFQRLVGFSKASLGPRSTLGKTPLDSQVRRLPFFCFFSSQVALLSITACGQGLNLQDRKGRGPGLSPFPGSIESRDATLGYTISWGNIQTASFRRLSKELVVLLCLL